MTYLSKAKCYSGHKSFTLNLAYITELIDDVTAKLAIDTPRFCKLINIYSKLCILFINIFSLKPAYAIIRIRKLI